MPKYLISVLDTQSNTGTDAEMVAIDAFNDRLIENDQLLFACGVHDPSEAVVIDGRSGPATFSEGPHFHEPEFLSGFWIIRADDDDEARALTAEASTCCNRKVELRRLHGD